MTDVEMLSDEAKLKIVRWYGKRILRRVYACQAMNVGLLPSPQASAHWSVSNVFSGHLNAMAWYLLQRAMTAYPETANVESDFRLSRDCEWLTADDLVCQDVLEWGDAHKTIMLPEWYSFPGARVRDLYAALSRKIQTSGSVTYGEVAKMLHGALRKSLQGKAKISIDEAKVWAFECASGTGHLSFEKTRVSKGVEFDDFVAWADKQPT